MLFRIQSESSSMPYMDSKKIDSYCSDILKVLQDDGKALSIFERGANLIQSTLKEGSYNLREAIRLRAFTSDLISRLESAREVLPASAKRERGRVVWFSNVRGFGFVDAGQKDQIFVHCTAVRGTESRYFLPGELVEFSVVAGPKGPTAQDVVVLKPQSLKD